ncbi:MAG: hypothetical protein LBR74_04165, partial [Eubacterium sp.]|nr:hypothetical protein [Eubacterium sp.]
PASPNYEYEQAIDLFEQLGDYKDSYELLQNARNALDNSNSIYAAAEAEAARQKEIAEREQKARDSLGRAQQNIVGTWTRGELGEYSYNRSGDSNYTESYANIGDKAKFADDGTVELYNGNIVTSGRYFFEDIYLIIRIPALLGGETEKKFTVFMDSDTVMEITEVGEDFIVDAEQDIFGFGSTYKTFYPTEYTKN